MKITSEYLNYKSKNSGFQKSKNEKNIVTKTTENQEIHEQKNQKYRKVEVKKIMRKI